MRFDPRPEWKHGTASTYSNQKCNCDPCREAWRVYTRERRTRIRMGELREK